MEPATSEQLIAIRDKALEVLKPFGFVDNEDADNPATLWHPVLKEAFDLSATEPHAIMLAVLRRGEENGAMEARRVMRKSLGLSFGPRHHKSETGSSPGCYGAMGRPGCPVCDADSPAIDDRRFLLGEVDRLRAVLIEIVEDTNCTCHEGWTSRGMHDDGCPSSIQEIAAAALATPA